MPLQITPDTLPDYHFLYIAPNVEPDWFFVAARQYYETYRPTIISNGDLIAIIPPSFTVVVSILARRDAFRSMAVQVAQARETAYLDALIYETATEAEIALNSRAMSEQPFGVPLVPTPTPFLRDPILPTPGAIIATPDPDNTNFSGFVTQVPTEPAGFITLTPSPTPNFEDDAGIVTSATPGAIVGGN
ncbi:MAG: hypothetical protein AAFU54_15845 [Chloroflexota bacterium]